MINVEVFIDFQLVIRLSIQDIVYNYPLSCWVNPTRFELKKWLYCAEIQYLKTV